MPRNPLASRAQIDAGLKGAALSKTRRATALKRVTRVRDASPARMVAYDFETSRIKVGTPRPLYLTAYGLDPDIALETPIRDFEHLLTVLEMYFLTPEMYGVKFVAWYGNNFDAYFIAAALVISGRYTIRPYLTRSKSVRGLRILRAGVDPNKKTKEFWEFLDGAAMLGLAGVTLEKFLNNFAPDLPKLKSAINFETEEFDASNLGHCAYAMRDSVGLYHGMVNAQSIMLERFNQPLAVTMGGACIKIFKAHIPEGVAVNLPRDEILTLTRDYVMRGGFCYCARRYNGPVWKYDLNQAYAAAMRESKLPCGFTEYTEGAPPANAPLFIARITAFNEENEIPFYYRTEIDGRMRSMFSTARILDTWLTSTEIEQLQREGWNIEFLECYSWGDSFSMVEYVDKLENGRMTCEGGPSGPIGTMYKMVGNHSYGKTVEQLEPIEFLLSAECPEGFAPYYGDDIEPMQHVYYRFLEDDEQKPKDYHQPQIGAFITAHVRMVVRRAALIDPGAWLYADTDCVIFSTDVTDKLDIHAKRYGAWKIEESGAHYQIIAKKVYTEVGPPGSLKRSAKGMNVRRLSSEDFANWYDGKPPTQDQVQRNNFLKVMQGAEMYRHQTRRGTAIEATPPKKSARVS